MKLIHWVLCGSAAVLGSVLLPANPAHQVEARLLAPTVPAAPAGPAAPGIPAVAAALAAPADAATEEKPLATVLRIYDVGDLVRVVADRPLGQGVLPPTQLNGGLNGRGSSYPNSSNRPAEPATEQTLSNLAALIQEDVDPESWKEQGGVVGSIRAIEKMLVVRQTAENQRKVAELLDLYRKSRTASRAVTVHADWLWLNPGDLAQVLRLGKTGLPGREVDPAAIQKLGPKALYAHGQITCAAGQTVHLLSGHVKTLVESLDASVGTGSSAYQPEVDEVLEGAAIQVTPNLQGESAVVDVLGFVSGWSDRGEPYRFLQHDAGPLPRTRPTDTTVGANYDSFANMDRMNVVAQEFSTTAHLPLGKAVLVAGMTLEPEGSGGGSARGDAKDAKDAKAEPKPGEGRQIYLVLRVDAE